jgi:hypothetical protein
MREEDGTERRRERKRGEANKRCGESSDSVVDPARLQLNSVELIVGELRMMLEIPGCLFYDFI